MSEIIYRKLKKEDYSQVMETMNQAFGLHRYVNNDKDLKILLKGYLESCLSEQTFSCVAKKDDKIIGIILGTAKNDYKIIPHIPHFILCIYYNVLMFIHAILHKVNSDGFKIIHRIYAEFLKKRKNEFDGVITLFAVNKECRGLGIGKKLLANLLTYLKKHDTENIYLFTDTTCNYGFYDSQGFNRLDEKSMTMTVKGSSMKMDVFLYGYNVK